MLIRRQLIKALPKLKPLKARKGAQMKVLKTTDGDIFVCKQGDSACWQRWTSAMTDCV